MEKFKKLDLLNALEVKKKKIRENAIRQYYPSKGPLRRELYQKHLEFFKAGKDFPERLALAANRVGKCVSGDTLIESPHGPPKQVKDIKGKHWVWAWDGEKKVPALAEEPFTKPSEMVYRVWLQSGQYVDCAAEHRFLSEAGWIFLSDLFGCVPCLPLSSSDSGPAKSLSGVRCLMRKLQDSLGDCHRAHRLYDEQPHFSQDSAQEFFPSQDDARPHNLVLSRLGALAGKCSSNLLPFFARLSSLYEEALFSVQRFGFLALDSCTFGELCPDLLQVFRPRHDVEAVFPQSNNEAFSHQDGCISALITPDGLRDSVICYQPIGVQPIYDFHVPVLNNYCSQGFIHHNTEGMGGYETALHLTGLYPDWWEGKRFTKPIEAWAAGDTSTTVRDIIQAKLIGPLDDPGTGLIPKDKILGFTKKMGVPLALDTLMVQHVSGGKSVIQFKSYDQKRKSFQGTKKDLIWLDEEPSLDIYTECLLRTMDTSGTDQKKGMILLTFTPLLGMSEVVLSFLPDGHSESLENESKKVVMATWDDVPHLTEAVKKQLWDSIPPYQRDARSKGIPQLGSGAIYPVPEDDIFVDDFEIPEHWPRVYALDVGWKRTAALWGAWDRESDIVYIYSEHYRGETEPSTHAQAIRARGEWICGVIDPAARGRSQQDGNQLMQNYVDLGLDLEPAFNGVESGIHEVYMRKTTGRLKVFKSLMNYKQENRLYRRNEKGQIVKNNDHLMDCERYLIMSGLERAKVKPRPKHEEHSYMPGDQGGGWMA